MRQIERANGQLITSLSTERLTELLRNPDFNALVNKINEEYPYWDKVKYMKMPEGMAAWESWMFAKHRRMQSLYKTRFGRYQFFWNQPSRIQELLHFFDMNIGGSLQTRSLVPENEKNRYLISSIMEEAIASSQIEGAVTTRQRAKDMLRKKKSPKNKSDQMIVNNYQTIQRILEIKDQQLTIEHLLEIHKLITTKTLDDPADEGALRRSNDVHLVDAQDSEVVYYPPQEAELSGLLDDFCIFFNHDDNGIFMHPIIKGCIIHFMVGFIHPFVDGNGRTARALFYWYLLKKGYWLTEYLSISRLILRSKTQYAKSFIYTETDDNDLTYFISYKLRTMKMAYEELRKYIQRKIIEKRLAAEFLKLDGVNDRQAMVLKWVYEEPSLILTAKEVELRLAVSDQTARNDLKELVMNGFLEEISINKKTRGFGKGPQFDYHLLTVKNLRSIRTDISPFQNTQQSLFEE